jgi:hypothetical protein
MGSPGEPVELLSIDRAVKQEKSNKIIVTSKK